jgi:hypothetical protein
MAWKRGYQKDNRKKTMNRKRRRRARSRRTNWLHLFIFFGRDGDRRRTVHFNYPPENEEKNKDEPRIT